MSAFDKLLASFVWNEELVSWDGTLELPERRSVAVSVLDEGRVGKKCVTPDLLTKLARIVKNLSTIRKFVASDLAVSAEEWAVSEDAIVKQIELQDIWFMGRTASVNFNDNNLFGGHLIRVYIDADGNPEQVDLAG